MVRPYHREIAYDDLVWTESVGGEEMMKVMDYFLKGIMVLALLGGCIGFALVSLWNIHLRNKVDELKRQLSQESQCARADDGHKQSKANGHQIPEPRPQTQDHTT